MSYNIETQIEWINWIEEAISKRHIKYYDYKHFKNIQKIGIGGFGTVYCANWRDSEQYLALKSFGNFDKITLRELVHEVKIHSVLKLIFYICNENIIYLLFSLARTST